MSDPQCMRAFILLDIYHCYYSEPSASFLSACQVHLLYYDDDQTAINSFTYYTNDTEKVSGVVSFYMYMY